MTINIIKTIAFRADSSLQIGTGHVMRCLTLADALKARGVTCHFICREHVGNLIDIIHQKGHIVHPLPTILSTVSATMSGSVAQTAHSVWLGTTREQDSQETGLILEPLEPDWLIVDHYALDARWEKSLRPHCGKVMVIDDLADRSHDCDLLLDQNLGRTEQDYETLVPARCTCLTGPRYSLLRPEFSRLREYSLSRRKQSRFKTLLITMGGVDRPNATSLVLRALNGCDLPTDLNITVVMGAKSPWLQDVKQLVTSTCRRTEIKVDVDDMAQIMADADLAIGAAGSTSWERCCLGLPSLIMVLAENQRAIASELHGTGAAYNMGDPFVSDFEANLKNVIEQFQKRIGMFANMTESAANVTDGLGVVHFIHKLASRGRL